MENPHTLPELLARARRRSIAHLILDQSALAAVVGMGGMILLLLAGTQILEWYWVLLLAAASLGAGLYRLRDSVPSSYEVAQRIDRRLSLADTLSTATYFAASEEAVAEKQRHDAEAVARTVDLNQGVPFRRSRYAYPALGLALVAFGLFAVRYAVTGSLSLQPSLVRIAFDTFFTSNRNVAKSLGQKPDGFNPPRADAASPDPQAGKEDPAPDSAPDIDAPDPNNTQGSDQAKSNPKEDGNKDGAGDKDGDDEHKQDGGPQTESLPNDKSGEGKEPQPGSNSANSSLLDKLRDAMANMMNKMKPGDKNQQQGDQQKGQQNGQQNQQNQQNQQQKTAQNSTSKAEGDKADGEAGDQSHPADAQGNEKAGDKSKPQDAKSGAGSDDGDKKMREAAELAAMGKISEILGKRAQNVTGEVMVEVGSSKQQLKTPWAQSQATHIEAGGEINRDEVPLIYQQFVQQYFEQIRKAPAPKAEPAKSSATKSASQN